jgi:hypothetical protein
MGQQGYVVDYDEFEIETPKSGIATALVVLTTIFQIIAITIVYMDLVGYKVFEQ